MPVRRRWSQGDEINNEKEGANGQMEREGGKRTQQESKTSCRWVDAHATACDDENPVVLYTISMVRV